MSLLIGAPRAIGEATRPGSALHRWIPPFAGMARWRAPVAAFGFEGFCLFSRVRGGREFPRQLPESSNHSHLPAVDTYMRVSLTSSLRRRSPVANSSLTSGPALLLRRNLLPAVAFSSGATYSGPP